MKGWIIYRVSEDQLKPEAYEINRFIDIANENGIELRVFSPEQFDITVTKDGMNSILVDGKYESLPDFVIPRMGAGTTYFALAIIRHLEKMGVFVVNSSDSIELVKDKLYSSQVLASNNIPVPNTMLAKYPVNVDMVEKHIGFPAVVKTLSGSQGSGVFLCETKTKFNDFMQFYKTSKSDKSMIIQEFIKDSHGRDLRVIVIGGRVISCMQRKTADGGFKANYSAGGTVESFEVTPEIEWLATQTASLLGLDFAGVDLLFDGDHYKICEANSSSGFEGMEKCCDVNVAHELYTYIKLRLGN